MNLFENLQLLKEKDNLGALNVKCIERKDNKVVDEQQPAYIVDFYVNNKHFGKASVCYNPDSNRNFLYNVKVFKEYRGQGLSHIIIQYMINTYNVSELYVNKSNIIAIKAYKKAGFKIINKFDDYYIMQI